MRTCAEKLLWEGVQEKVVAIREAAFLFVRRRVRPHFGLGDEFTERTASSSKKKMLEAVRRRAICCSFRSYSQRCLNVEGRCDGEVYSLFGRSLADGIVLDKL